MKRYLEYDRLRFSFREATVSVWRYVRLAVKVLLVSVAFTVIGYGLVALVFSTRTEKRLERQIDSLSTAYARLHADEQIVGDVITGLQLKDAVIYGQVFNSDAPNVDPVGNLDFLYGSDTIPDRKLVSYTASKASELEERADKVEQAFRRIFAEVSSSDFLPPPMALPLHNITYPQVGAGMGEKIQPFYRTRVFHNGLDLIAPQGDPVYAPVEGVVTIASRSRKGQGNIVEIRHAGGYLTRYEHLSDISVAKGTNVRRGQKIGTVGITGQAFAPHLHYEVLRDTVYLNPINYIFASVTPEEYSNMLFMAANTMQSMD